MFTGYVAWYMSTMDDYVLRRGGENTTLMRRQSPILPAYSKIMQQRWESRKNVKGVGREGGREVEGQSSAEHERQEGETQLLHSRPLFR